MLQQIFLSGAVINFFLVIAGSLVGLLFRKGIPDRIKDALMKGMALCVLYIGISGLFENDVKILVIIISFALGAVIGELIDLDRCVNRLGQRLESGLNRNGGSTKISDGFVTATLLFCVGAMTVVGSIDSGISGDNATLYSKALIDGISAIAFTSSLGIGVMLSAAPVLIIEGGLTLLAAAVQPVLTGTVITQMSVIGSLLIIAISFNMLEITKIKVMNYLPAIFLPVLLCLIPVFG